ncbi:PTS sugar transporter subunit IIA [Pantoea stewartii]|uniref:PTS sugar transporter subunit IIA n=1 Tax=Pantoea stewartii TaxID=66269 RepID=UPI0021E80FD3|nr:PTS sugar transporter subunit IIA [Pantoea stewartii]UYK97330.1 PTS sugar transporter subunit IIA [Pantoea stewartii]
MANLTQWLSAEKIQYIERVSDWKEAIQVTGNPLCREGAISQDYIDTIVRLKEETGPYFVIAPRIAMPHARPEQGAKKLGLSVVKLATPVNFDADENDPVDILFMFSAPDSNSHIEMISQLAEVLTDEDIMQRVYHAQSQQELCTVLLADDLIS